MNQDDISNLYEIGLINNNKEQIRTNDISIIPFLGKYFTVNLRRSYPASQNKDITEVYIGPDSYLLIKNILNSCKFDKNTSALDLCTGSGIAAIFCAVNGVKGVKAIDINPASVNAASFNALLNNVEDKISILQGNLFEPIKNERFDFISANPPFIPVPNKVNFPIAGDGGPLGIDIYKKIFSKLKYHLKTNGTSIIIGESLGNSNLPIVSDILKRLSKDNKWDTILILNKKVYAQKYLRYQAEISTRFNDLTEETLINEWKKITNKKNQKYYYAISIIIKNTGKYSFNIFNFSNQWSLDNIIKKTSKLQIKSSNQYEVYKNGSYQVQIDSETKDLLINANNDLTVEDAVKKIFPAYSKKYGKYDIDQMYGDALEILNELEMIGFVKRGRKKIKKV